MKAKRTKEQIKEDKLKKIEAKEAKSRKALANKAIKEQFKRQRADIKQQRLRIKLKLEQQKKNLLSLPDPIVQTTERENSDPDCFCKRSSCVTKTDEWIEKLEAVNRMKKCDNQKRFAMYKFTSKFCNYVDRTNLGECVYNKVREMFPEGQITGFKSK
jgi:hypothetical protein